MDLIRWRGNRRTQTNKQKTVEADEEEDEIKAFFDLLKNGEEGIRLLNLMNEWILNGW